MIGSTFNTLNKQAKTNKNKIISIKSEKKTLEIIQYLFITKIHKARNRKNLI